MSQNKPSPPKIKRQKERKPKRPRKITESYLHNAGLYYLERYASSTGNFESVMMRKVKKSCAYHEEQDLDTCAEMVRTLVQKFIDLELLNDDIYTRGKVRSLRNRGKSKRYILGHLKTKGVSANLIEKHLETLQEEQGENDHESEFKAAIIFARKKRIGPFRISQKEPEEQNHNKELGKFARAGFSYDTSRRVLDLKNPSDITL